MPEPVPNSDEPRRRRPVCSVVSLCCVGLLIGTRVFVATAQGQRFNEQLFGRHYTAGAVLMVGFYGAIGLGLVLLGLALGVIAFLRRENPVWAPCLAAAVNAIAAVAVLTFFRGR